MPDDEPKNNSAEPLRGIVLCCTSIPPEKREELASRAEQMGAIHKLDLTSDVTHLIVGATDTPKYKYVAKERPDVKVLSPEWIGAIRKSWLEGEEIDVRALEETHKLPSLAGLKICLTGFDDPLERQHLQRLITVNGASYHADLTKSATHLLANRTEGEKYKYAKLWALRVVAPEWLKDSIGRGMVLEEALYDPLLPSEDRGRDAWVRSPAQGFALGKRRHEETMSAEPVSLDVAGRSRKLRRTTSTKLESQNSTIWNDIVGGGFTAARAETDDWPDAAGDGAGDQRFVGPLARPNRG
ncbi:MAG: hypothetical protein M1817_005766 [Caeruleum heppii]|nr:MAG: hypothetical protein M1817_005766 [Caeruleum heppii]